MIKRMAFMAAFILVIVTSVSFGVYLERAMADKNQSDEVTGLKATITDLKAENKLVWQLYIDQVGSNTVMYHLLFGDEEEQGGEIESE